MRRRIVTMICLLAMAVSGSFAAHSVAGLFPLEGSGRVIYNFNQGWRFYHGDVQ